MKRERVSECGGCGLEDPLLLYNAGPRSSGIYRRLCAACVLKSHQGSFCPLCFDLIDDSHGGGSGGGGGAVVCRSCHSLSHSSCVVPFDPAYQCPPCSNPNFLYFPPYSKKSKPLDSSSQSCDSSGRTLDKDSTKALLAAVRISAASMAKAANVARIEAEKRVKEAAFAKKRAREALERVAYLASTKDSKDRIPPNKASKGVAFSTAHKIQRSRIDTPMQKRIQNQSGHDEIETPEAAVSAATAIVPVPPIIGVSSTDSKDVQIHSSVQVDKDSNGSHLVSPLPVRAPQPRQSTQ